MQNNISSFLREYIFEKGLQIIAICRRFRYSYDIERLGSLAKDFIWEI